MSTMTLSVVDASSMVLEVENDNTFNFTLRSFSEGTGRFELVYASLAEALAGEEDSKPIAPDVFLQAVTELIQELAPVPDPRYSAELVASPASGTLTLKLATETTLLTALTNSNTFSVALPTPVSGKVNESILVFKIGASLPSITNPVGIKWRGKTPTLAINKDWTICYEQIEISAGTWEVWATAISNA